MTSEALLFGVASSQDPQHRPPRQSSVHAQKAFLDPLIVFAVVLITSLIGIVLQPHGLLSSFWVANAVLLGLMLRAPSMATRAGWAAATIAYMAADLSMGSSIERAALLTAGNLVGVFVCFALFRRLDPREVRLQGPFSAIYMLFIVLAGSASAGLVGMIANPVLFQNSVEEGFLWWSVSEFINYLAVLPVMLTATFQLPKTQSFRDVRFDLIKALPALACLLGVAMAPLAHGPSAVVYPLPGLIWCALVYDIAVVAALSAAIAGWTLVAVSMGWVYMGFPVETFTQLRVFRIEIALVLLGPISVAGVMAARNASLREAFLAREAAERAMSSRALLLATMTHELRSPLNSIVGFASLVERPPKGSTQVQQAEYGEIIRQAAMHMNELVTDLLDTARVEAGQHKLAPAATASRPMLEQSMRLVMGMATERQVRITVQDGYWPIVDADPRAIKQVMINLLSNAVKASSKESSIVVSGSIEKGRLFVRVADSGPGISPQELERLGRPYAQAGSETSRRQGTGLGLSLSMHLIAQHGGALRLESEPGKGTTAIFDLPLSEEEAANDS